MFRMANMDETEELAKFLSSIATKTIYEAIEQWAPTNMEISAIYTLTFDGFFEGVSEYLPLTQEMVTRWKTANWNRPVPGGIRKGQLPVPQGFSSDEILGKEILARKLKRMKEKLSETDHYYTFDLFEELLLFLLISDMKVFHRINESGEATDLTEEECAAADTLIKKYGFSAKMAVYVTLQVHRVYEMPEGLEEGFYGNEDEDDLQGDYLENLFFWDDDFGIFFEKGFLDGIQMCASPIGAGLGYGYDYACEILTDMGFKVPLRLVGTKAGSVEREKAAEEMFRSAFEEPVSGGDDVSLMEIPKESDEDLPYI